MRRFAFVGLIATALLAFGALGTTSAFASHVLPEFSVETSSKGTSGLGKLGLTGANVECASGTNTSTSTGSKSLYKFTIDFHGCELGKKECHSLLDKEGLILVTGTWHIELLQLPTHYWFIYFTIEPVHIECEFLKDLIIVEGSVLGKITATGTAKKNFLIEVNAPGGVQEFTKYENDNGEEITAKLEGAINEGGKKPATENSANNKIETELETEIVN